MANRLTIQHLAAEISTLDHLLIALPQGDVLGRLGLEHRKQEISDELSRLQQHPDQVASVALLFAGRPVAGSQGIESIFATEAVSEFQQLITNVWASEEGEVGRRGPVERQDESHLHITALLHGSVGFLLEELDEQTRITPSPLKRASEKATEIIRAFTTDDDGAFRAVLEDVDNRVLGSTREFLRRIYRGGATVRLVEGNSEFELDYPDVERAYQRAENASLEELQEEIQGQLLGLIPYGRRFEVRLNDGTVISGSVAPTLSESYLQKLSEEQFVGQECQARIRRKRITRFGRTTESIVLLDIAPLSSRPTSAQEQN